jgi:hypothetical protein
MSHLAINAFEGRLLKERKSFFVVLSIIFLFNGACSSEPAINKSKFAKLSIAALAVKTSITAGESHSQVADREQQLFIEIMAFKDKVVTKEEKKLLQAYSDLFAIYSDGLELWQCKLDFAFFDSQLKGRIYVCQYVEPIVEKYRLSTESHLYKPTGQYWKSIGGDSIQIIWENADSQLKLIDDLINY